MDDMGKLTRVRRGTDITMRVHLRYGDDDMPWSLAVPKRVCLLAMSPNRAVTSVEWSIDEDDPECLVVIWRANRQKELGVYHLVVTVENDGVTATYDAPAFELVPLSERSDGNCGCGHEIYIIR